MPALAGPGSGLPEVSLGSNPYRSFGGGVESSPVVLLTVPEGQEFIVTTVLVEHLGRMDSAGISGFQLLQDGTPVLGGTTLGIRSLSGIGRGLGRLRLEAGSTLSIDYNGSDPYADFYVEGRFVQAGSPYRSFYGTTSGAGPRAVFSADADRDFIVRTAVVWGADTFSQNCDIYLDGEMHLSQTIQGTFSSPDYHTRYAASLASGQGALVVPAGSELSLHHAISGCGYYIDGEYITP